MYPILAGMEDMRPLAHAFEPKGKCPPALNAVARGFFAFWIGPMLGNASNSGTGEKRDWWLRSATPRRWVAKIVPMTVRLSGERYRTGYALKAPRLRLGALLRLGYQYKGCICGD